MSADLSAEVERYLARTVTLPNGCRVLPGAVRYGDLQYVDSAGKARRTTAHRAVLIAAGVDMDSTDVARHRCDNPPCVNIDHLERGTQAQNVRDMYGRDRAHNRWSHGESHCCAVLTTEAVADLRRSALAGASLRGLAKKHGLGYSVVRSAVRGVTWAHVTDPAPIPDGRAGRSSANRTLLAREPESCATAARMIADGRSLREVGDALGVSRTTARAMASQYQRAVSAA